MPSIEVTLGGLGMDPLGHRFKLHACGMIRKWASATVMQGCLGCFGYSSLPRGSKYPHVELLGPKYFTKY